MPNAFGQLAGCFQKIQALPRGPVRNILNLGKLEAETISDPERPVVRLGALVENAIRKEAPRKSPCIYVTLSWGLLRLATANIDGARLIQEQTVRTVFQFFTLGMI